MLQMVNRKRPTPRQRKAARAVADNLLSEKPLSTGQVLESVGYGKIVQDPKRILETPGFKQALYDLGLTENLITSSLVEDIKDKPKNRLGELKLGAELLGMVRKDPEIPQDKNSNTTYNFIFSPENQADVKAMEEKIKARLIQKQNV